MLKRLIAISLFLFPLITFGQDAGPSVQNLVNPPPEAIIPSADVNPPTIAGPADVAKNDKEAPLKDLRRQPGCPPPSAYQVPPGYRIAGISPPPNCLGVPALMIEPNP